MNDRTIITYEKIRPSLQTFDVLNCIYGTNPWSIMDRIMGAIGHTAMVYRCRETGQIMVYESTQTSRRDKLSGVQLRPMNEWLENYNGKVYLRHIHFESLGVFSGHDRRVMAEIECARHIHKYRGTAYPDLSSWKWRWFLINAAIDLPSIFKRLKKALENDDIDTVMFCAHLLGNVFKWCGLSIDTLNAAELDPDDLRWFSQIFESYLKVGILFSQEIRIK